ncbi:10250_t:CDS:2 [Paraglomus brasilianum]|uniref:Chromatin modification-related protein n=1 Tax=Paraglomus brasilianum TaxID=144538 RepID=A0A9N8WLX5_9GLOM|nr:10250_t:CDS:2 [Paraglomus brasilianum]
MRPTMMPTNGSNKAEKSERGSKMDKLDSRSDKDNLVYLDDYVDTIESLPSELQRNFSLMRELDARCEEAMNVVAKQAAFLLENAEHIAPEERIAELKKLSDCLTESLKDAEEKCAMAQATYKTVDRHVRRLDDDLQRFEDEQMTGPGRIVPTAQPITSTTETPRKNGQKEKDKKESRDKRTHQTAQEQPNNKRRKHKDNGTPPPSNGRNGHDKDRNDKPKKARKDSNKGQRKTKDKQNNVQTTDMPIDPNEPTYCYCQQVSYGEMVACDDDECEIEWFHYACVDLKAPPPGKWYCKECTEKQKNKQKK